MVWISGGTSSPRAEALESAHEKGIIHRANIKITPDGRVKVLDFWLAKAFPGEGLQAEVLPTVSLDETRAGAILGTAAYNSPEQARGKLDKRTDVWSFGCVLYEALARRRAIQGETLSDILAGVLQHEPKLDALPADVPPNIRALVRRCLHKDREQRLRDVGGARIEIDETLGQWGKAGPPDSVGRQPRRPPSLEDAGGRGRSPAVDQRHGQNSSHVLFFRWALAVLSAEPLAHLSDARRRSVPSSKLPTSRRPASTSKSRRYRLIAASSPIPAAAVARLCGHWRSVKGKVGSNKALCT